MSVDVEIIAGLPVVVSPFVPDDAAYILNLRGQDVLARSLEQALQGRDFAVLLNSPDAREKLRGNVIAIRDIKAKVEEMQR